MPSRVWIFWALFLIRGTFYCAMLPLWEGWDEYAHFAWLQHWQDSGTLPLATDTVSREIDESMRLAPLARELRWIGSPYLTYSDYWALPAGERERRQRALADLSPELAHQAAMAINGKPFVFYEAQQPPLYYWLASAVVRPAANWSLSHRVFLERMFSVLLASLTIPFTFFAAARICSASNALWCAGLLAVAPGLVIDAAHVANDSLAIALAAIFMWLMARERATWPVVGLTLGAAILSKASLLVLIPVLVVVWFRRPRQLLSALILTGMVGGWWYVRNLTLGLPFTGWQESTGLRPLVTAALDLFHDGGWINEAHTIAKSFTWFGAWSFLSLRTWMYLSLEICALAGMLIGLVRGWRQLRLPFTITMAFTVAIIGGAAAYFAVHRVAGIPGWYLWPAGGAMAILVAAGLGRFSAFFAAMLALADIFGATTRMMPYYAGLAPWNHGSVAQLREAAAHLHTPLFLIALWMAATVAIPLLMFQGRAKTRM